MTHSNKKDFQCNDIKIKHLYCILKNLDLGEEHLKKHLKFSDYNDLLNIGKLTKNQKDNILADKKEKSGKSANFINGVLTGILGGWMGLYDFFHLNIDSKIELWVVFSVAFLAGGTVGFLSYQSMSEENKKIIRKQKLKNIQLKLIDILIEKKRARLEKMISRYNRMLENPHLRLPKSLESKDKVEKIKPDLVKLISKKTENIKFLDARVSDKINRYFMRILRKPVGDKDEKQKDKYPAYFKILSNPNLKHPKSPQTVYHWALKNSKNIMINLFPAMLGGFGSMFVFLSGMPNIFKKIGYQHIAQLFERPAVTFMGLSAALLITVYLSYFTIKSLYRLYKQETSIENTQKKITERELEFDNINHLYVSVAEIFKEMKKIKLISSILKNIHNIDQNQIK